MRLTISLFLVTLSVGYVASNVLVLKSEREKQGPPPVPLGLPRQSDRVIVIVLDGVPVRVAYDKEIMPFVSELAAQGASGVLRAPEETTTPAGVRALATGQNTSVADMLDMFRETEYKGWTIFDDIIGRGESVSISGDKAWTSLLASRDPKGLRVTALETRLYQNSQTVLADAAARIESDSPPVLTIVHVSETDKLGHLYGTENQEYKTRMRAIDAQLRAFVQRVLTPNATLLITADHGNDVFGSHGGEEDVYRNVPIVMTGRGIQTRAKIRMDARALPGALAVLLGTRIPAQMQAVIPVQAFALNTAERSALMTANAQQLQRLAEIRGVQLPASIREVIRRTGDTGYDIGSEAAVSKGLEVLSAAVVALDAASPVNIPRILWALVLFSGLFIVAFDVLWPVSQLRDVLDRSLWIIIAFVVASILVSRFTVPLLWLVLVVEILLLTLRLVRHRSRAAFLGFAGAIVVAVLPAVRFTYMPQIKTAIRIGGIRIALFLAVLLAAGFALMLRRSMSFHLRRNTETYLVAVLLLAISLLTPFSPVPIILTVVTVMALRSSDVGWMQVSLIAAGLVVFFFLSERIGFARTGEAPVARYAYAGVTCAVITAAVLLRSGAQARALALAWLSWVPLWPFGYVKIGGSNPSFIAGLLLVILPLGVAAGLAARQFRLWWAYLPLCATVFFHLYPTHVLFWAALASHVTVVGVVALMPAFYFAQPAIVVLTAVSGLILMSPVGAAPSILLVALGTLAVSRVAVRGILPATVILFGAALLVFGRYALVGVFTHGPSIGCTLKCIDEASGFLGFDETRWTWAGGLIALKMIGGSVLLFALMSLNRAFYSAHEQLIAATLLLALSFVSGAASNAALSFGWYGARLGLSLGQAGYATVILLSLVLGYWAYRSIYHGAIADRIARTSTVDSSGHGFRVVENVTLSQ